LCDWAPRRARGKSGAGNETDPHTGAVPGSKEVGLGEIAERQAGAIASRQLRAIGMSRKDVEVRLRRGSLQTTPARGVYRVAGAERNWRQKLWIAILAGPEGTLASHVSAAAVWGLVAPPSIPQVTVPRTASGRFGGAVVHHATIAPVDRTYTEGIETTDLARTVVDCAAVLHQKGLNDLVDAAFGKRLCKYDDVLTAWERAGHVRGGMRLEEALAPYSMGAEPGSVAAARVLRRICEWGFPLPLCEFEIRDEHGEWVATVDFFWPRSHFVLEYDGEEWHGPRRRRLDARRQAAVEALGLRVERTDSRDARPSSTRLFDLLKEVLGDPAVEGNLASVRRPSDRRRPPRASAV